MSGGFDPARETFFAESAEMLQQMENALLTLERDPGDMDTVHALFRAAHTVKGSAGMFGYQRIVAFMHRVESVLERARSGELTVDAALLSALLPCTDFLATLLHAVREEGGEERTATLLDRDAAALTETLEPYLVAPAQRPQPSATAEDASRGIWHLSLRLSPEALRNGLDPLGFIRYLDTLGEVLHIAVVSDALPPLPLLDPEACYLGFEIRLDTAAQREKIVAVFEFLREDCTLRLVPPGAGPDEYLRLIEQLPEPKDRLTELLVASGAITAEAVARSCSTGHAPPQPVATKPPGESREAQRPPDARAPRGEESRFVRVQADKLDRLINLVGELVIAGAGANLRANQVADAQLIEATDAMSGLVEEIRNSALQLRMVQIGDTFARFRRVVRDVSEALGKRIELDIHGAETELDKSVVEKIADPLMHLVRNAIDHGIETPAARAAAGKPPVGRLTLSAWHDSGSVLIEVRDDGAGLNRARILQKAWERGVIAANQDVSDQEIANLIFLPGFSTATTVTDLSGRGVGMDVVKRNIDALRGSVQVSSEPGRGTAFTIRLPLTLAIIDGFLVGVGNASYVVPLDLVEECIELRADGNSGVIDLRGSPLPFLRLRGLFELDGERPARESVVVVRAAGQRAGLVVDRLIGEFQTVIKPLGRLFQRVDGIGGSTILGSGEVALILDVPALVAQAGRVDVDHESVRTRTAIEPAQVET
jgi:two-component system chemotaxis sensor kinase CheA